MLRAIVVIFFFQLLGEALKKFFEMRIPGPVIGLILLLITLIFLKRYKTTITMAEAQKTRRLRSGKQLKHDCFRAWLFDWNKNKTPKKNKVLLNPTIKHAERI